MKKVYTLLFLFTFSITFAFAQVEGTWKMSPQAGAFGVGPNQGEIWWWNNDQASVTTRACYFDDEFEISAGGDFQNVLQNETWIEGWQGGSDACGTPVYPHDGSIPATWVYDAGAGTLTLNGTGSYLGLPKVYNGGELTDPANAPSSITYLVQFNATSDTMTADINYGGGWWRYILTTNAAPPPPPPDPVYLPVTFDNTGLDYRLIDFGGNWSSIIEDPDDATNYVVETFRDDGAQTWAGTVVADPSGLAEPIPFIDGHTTMSLRVYSPEAGVPVLLKLEVWDNTGIFTEVIANTTVANEWETLNFDFSADPNFDLANPYNKPIVFFNFGTSGGDAGEMTFMWDDMEYIYPVPAYTYNDFDANQNNEFSGDPSVPVIVANPDPSGMNTSDNCMEYLKDQADQAFVYTELDELINFENGTNFQLKVHSDTMCQVTFKLENRYDNWISTERTAMITDTSEWVLLNFDFSGEASGRYSKIVIFFGFSETIGETFYFDDVVGPAYDTPKPYSEENVQDNFEDDGWSTISGWKFQDPDFNDLQTTTDPADENNTVADYTRSGSFQYTNAQVELDHILDLSERNKFELNVYFPSSNVYGSLKATAAIKLQNSLYIENAWWTQVEIVQEVSVFDEWVTLTFDFIGASDRTDFDMIVVQLGGEGHNEPAQFYFDDLYLKHVPYITIEAPNGGEKIDQGSSFIIEWDYDYWEGSIDIELIKEGGDPVLFVNNLAASDTVYEWNVFPDQEPGDDYRIIITSHDDIFPTDTSDAYFTIVEVDGVLANFSAEPTAIMEGESVTFTDLSSGDPETWEWFFEGGTPETFEGQNPPEIVYENPGTYDVSLTVNKGNDENETLKEDYIEVTEEVSLTPPNSLVAVVGGYDDVQLSWSAPGTSTSELIYDNDVATGAYYWDGSSMATHMSPTGSCKIIAFKFYTSIQAGDNTFNAELYNWTNDAPEAGDPVYTETVTAQDDMWVTVDVSGQDLMVDGDFVVGFGSINETTSLGFDTNLDNGRSWDYSGGAWSAWTEAYLIRAIVQYEDGQVAEIGNTSSEAGSTLSVLNHVAHPTDYTGVNPVDPIGNLNSQTRELMGYNVYRDDMMINTELVTATQYNDPEPPLGSHDYYVTAMYDSGESDPSNVVSVIVTDINEIETGSIVVYPNPTEGIFTIAYTGNSTLDISLVDMAGKEVFRSTVEQTSTFNVTHLESGIYFLCLLDKASNKPNFKKLIVR